MAKIKTYLSWQCCGIDQDDKTSLVVGLGWGWGTDAGCLATLILERPGLSAPSCWSLLFHSWAMVPQSQESSHLCCIPYCELNSWACVLILHWPSRTPRLARQRTQFWQKSPFSQSSQRQWFRVHWFLLPSSHQSSLLVVNRKVKSLESIIRSKSLISNHSLAPHCALAPLCCHLAYFPCMPFQKRNAKNSSETMFYVLFQIKLCLQVEKAFQSIEIMRT